MKYWKKKRFFIRGMGMKEGLKNYLLDIFKTKNKKVTLIAYITTPFITNIIVEMLNSRSFVSGMTYIFTDTFSFMINLLIIAFTMSIGLLIRKRLAYILTVAVVWIGLGTANFVITSKRKTPFSATDLKLLSSIDDTIEKYLNAFEFIMIIIAIAIVVTAVAFVWMKLPKYAEKISYVRNILFIILTFLVMSVTVNIGFATGEVSSKFPNMTIAYDDYGFPYCFVTSFIYKGVAQPDEYSKDAVKDIIERMDSTVTVDSNNQMTPNVIFLQLESFFDVEKMKELEFSAEVTPVFNRLKEEYPSGYLTVNNVGYGTANTEFEVMTGLNLDDFGPGEFPYTTILTTNTCETTGYILKELGYSTHAVHNNTAVFYSRRAIFKRLGFDTFTSIEYMYPEEFTPTEWAKDAMLTDEIMKVLSSTEETDYIYAISVQGHGDYPDEQVLDDPAITVVDGIEDEGRKNMFEYYVNMIAEMDTFVGELIEELDKSDEDTLLVIYGDHLPSLDIKEDDLINGNLYQTEYVVWNNFNLEMADKDIESYQLSSRILEHLNIDGGVINKFHQTYKNDENYLDRLHLLTFDILYGNMFTYDGINPYIATDMKMGTYDIEITDIEPAQNKYVYAAENDTGENQNVEDASDGEDTAGEEETSAEEENTDEGETTEEENPESIAPDWYIVKGRYFTECSFVAINGKECDTRYIDPETLLIYAPQIDSLDVLVINQKSNSIVLSSSEGFTYFNIYDTPTENPDEDNNDSEDDNFGADKEIQGDI